MFKSQTIHDAYGLPKLQEATLASISRKTKHILEKPVTVARSMNSNFKTPFWLFKGVIPGIILSPPILA